jgi:hypothetical protein
MHPEDQPPWEQGPAPEWDREAVWERITQLQQRPRTSRRRRWAVAASVLVLALAGGIGGKTLFFPPEPDEILPMMKDRELDTELLPADDSLFIPVEPLRPSNFEE